MDYNLAKELQEAGFNLVRGDVNTYQTFQLGADTFREPTLSQLIEACGERFMTLDKLWQVNKWTAEGGDIYRIAIGTEGNTPEEAVAKLWLALMKKQL